MIVYNITIKIDPAINDEWIDWQKKEHIPEIMSTGLFNDHKFFKLLEQDETEGLTYVIQYFTSIRGNYDEYIKKFAPLLRQKALEKWGEKFVAFRTVMEVVH
jgi:hypothetical protein